MSKENIDNKVDKESGAIVNVEAHKKVIDKIDKLFDKGDLTRFEIRVVLQDMLRREEWMDRQSVKDEIIKAIKSKPR